MSYSPITDFIALLRQTSGGVRTERMPGLDYLVAGLARAEMFSIWVGSAAPVANQATTIWFLPASPSWVAEGAVFLWNASTQSYQPATPALWNALFIGTTLATVFQSIAVGAGAINPSTTLLAIERANPGATALTLPAVATRTRALQIVDWSSAVVNHAITLTPAAGETVMRLTSFELLSTPDQLSGVTLKPSTDLIGWVVAP
jgi:hypothetical protein